MVIFGLIGLSISVLIFNIYNLIKRKNFLTLAGENIVMDNRKMLKNWAIILNTILAIFWIVRFILIKHWIAIFGIIYWVSYLSIFLSIKFYENVNGIYKNGIIYNEYSAWKEIHSYRWIDESKISFTKNNGETINFENVLDRDKVIEIMINNKIQEIN